MASSASIRSLSGGESTRWPGGRQGRVGTQRRSNWTRSPVGVPLFSGIDPALSAARRLHATRLMTPFELAALAITAAAAVCDLRTGHIPNWLTLGSLLGA